MSCFACTGVPSSAAEKRRLPKAALGKAGDELGQEPCTPLWLNEQVLPNLDHEGACAVVARMPVGREHEALLAGPWLVQAGIVAEGAQVGRDLRSQTPVPQASQRIGQSAHRPGSASERQGIRLGPAPRTGLARSSDSLKSMPISTSRLLPSYMSVNEWMLNTRLAGCARSAASTAAW